MYFIDLMLCIHRPKGENVDVKALGEYNSGKRLCPNHLLNSFDIWCVHVGAQQCFVVFDVLMVNDTNLANCPLKERAEQLKKCVLLKLLTHLHDMVSHVLLESFSL